VKIKLTSVYVHDQEKALRFYTEVLGFVKKADFSQGPFRWLTVASAEDPDGTELQLALNDSPAAKAYQQAMFQQSQPAAMFFTDDVQADYERMKTRGAEFTMPPTDVTASKIAMLKDTCGNLIQVTQLKALVGLTFRSDMNEFIEIGERRRRSRARSATDSGVGIGHIPPSRSVMVIDGRNAADVTSALFKSMWRESSVLGSSSLVRSRSGPSTKDEGPSTAATRKRKPL
jgi:predicted enzyme related to lactoylglutathione lyase